MKKKGFTLIELLAVIIILAIIVLIATPIILNVVDDARESGRRSSVALYADAINYVVYEKYFKNGGIYPSIDKNWVTENVTHSGEKVDCSDISFNVNNGVILNECQIGTNLKKYCFANNKTYEDCNDTEYVNIYEGINAQEASLIETLLKQYNDTNTLGLLKDADANSYYYKGNNDEVTNNYVWYQGYLWRVVSINEDNTITMITQDTLTRLIPLTDVWGYPWSTEEMYIDSKLNVWLNDEFLAKFEDQSKVQDTVFDIGTYKNSAIEAPISTQQKVGLLSYEQLEKTEKEREFSKIITFLDNGTDWLLSNISVAAETDADLLYVSNDTFSGIASNELCGVRPVIRISDLTITKGNGSSDRPYKE